MKISDAIIALKACLDSFGDVECGFTNSAEGNPAIELKDVDTAKTTNLADDEILRFYARFPTKDLFISSLN